MSKSSDEQVLEDNSVYVHKLTLTGHPFIKDVCIDTHDAKKHIIITGKNGVGKSTFLSEIKDAVSNCVRPVFTSSSYSTSGDCKLDFNSFVMAESLSLNHAIKAFFNAKRTTELDKVSAVSSAEIKPQEIDQPLSQKFKQHLVNSRSQLAFASDDGEAIEATNLQQWFVQLDAFMSEIFEGPVQLKFDRKALDYKIESEDGSLLDFNHLSEGYGAIINIVTEIIMRMEAIEHGNFTLPGIVLIDEIETHLHVKLQKKILSLLTTFFPNIQFIVTTHSPFVLTSLEDAVVFDMETNTLIDSKADLWQFSYEDILEGYFDTEPYSLALEGKIEQFEALSNKDTLTVKENKALLLLTRELKDVPTFKLADIELRLQALGLKP